MSASEEGQVNLNYPAQDKNFQANPAHDLWIQKSLNSDRVAPVKQLEELVDRMIGSSSGMVKDQPSLSFVSYGRTVDGDLLLKLQTGEYYVVPTHEDGTSKFFQLVNVLPELLKLSDTSTSLSSKEAFESFQGLQPTDVYTKLKELVPRTYLSSQEVFEVCTKLLAGTEEVCITDTTKTSPSSQEASELVQGLQEAKVVPGHKKVILPELVAGCVKPDKVCIKDTTKTSPSSQEAYESSLGLQQASMAPGDIEERTLSEPVAEVLKPDKDSKTNPSSPETSESSQGLQQANMVPGHNEEGTLSEHVAECERPNNVGSNDRDEEQDSHEKQIMRTFLKGQLFVLGDIEPLMDRWIQEGKKSNPSPFMLARKMYNSLVYAHPQPKYNVMEEGEVRLRRKQQTIDRAIRKMDLNGYPPNGTGDYCRQRRKMDLNGYPPDERMLASLKSRIREDLRNLKMHLDYCHTHVSTNYSCEDQDSAVNLNRSRELLHHAHQILKKERSNKNILDIIDITVVEALIDKSNQLTEAYFAKKTDILAVDRRFKEAYDAVRESFANIRRNIERWRDAVLHSVVPWFKEGAYNSNVRKLMSRSLARFGKGGNGELVEAFQSGERLAIKQTLLRESEWSIVTQMDHPNVMPWLALICGDRSDTKPGQIVSYQVMPKMTEDLSASIRKMGGSIHHYILQLQEAEEPNSVLSAKADLVRQRSAEILRGTLQGLDYMHKQNLVHRDIKASNILLKRPVDCPHEAVHTCDCLERWEVRVADFDSVIHLSVAHDRAQRRKQLKVGNTGTSGYRAPEVFFESCTSDIDAEDYYSPASDIWSFGSVCLHLAMGFCCPRHQYQVGLIMLARHNLVNIPADEAQEKVDRTVGMYHIRQGFTGEKWQNMINFTARPLEVDWSKRPSAETLLKDPFVKPATTLDNSQTVTSTKDDKNVQRHQEPSLDHK